MSGESPDNEMAAAEPPRPFLIGLTGPIGCGKSTVARMLADVGGTVVDADVLARRVTEPGTAALARIRQRFGERVIRPDGRLDRSALAAIVFSDSSQLADLERIVHPEVRRLVNEQLAQAAQQRVPFVALEAIKLVEGGLADQCDEVWLIDCEASTQRARLYGRRLSRTDAERRLTAQGTDLVDRLESVLAGRVVVRRLATDDSLDQTRDRVEDALADALEHALEPHLGNDSSQDSAVK